MLNRRTLMLAGGSALGLALAGLGWRAARTMSEKPDLVADKNGLIDLKPGFRYVVLSHTGDAMSDGLHVPGRPDGMAAFAGPGDKVILVRNHELGLARGLFRTARGKGAFGEDEGGLSPALRARLYDPGGKGGVPYGGVTTLIFDPARERLTQQSLSLAGTMVNCAGGPTPWGSWLSCEENVLGEKDGLGRDHGFVFEVPARTEIGLAPAQPITAMGRFVHEAAAVDPMSGAVYLTEDNPQGCLYRFKPATPGALHAGGRLEALAIAGQPQADTANWDKPRFERGTAYPIAWVGLEDVAAPSLDLAARAQAAGAARFVRGEGVWMGAGELFFSATAGGPNRRGQIWRLGLGADGQESLQLLAEPNDDTILDMPDNLTVSPWGTLIVCEDGGGDNYLRQVRMDGQITSLARNAHPGRSEFAGACFSPDGRWLFVNIQEPGITLAITGPWDTLA
ncbi:MAG: alkaline phosphatase PhoX [Pseudomonadota bacterium]